MARLDLYVVIAYMVGILAAGFWARRKATTQDQFLVAGRSVGLSSGRRDAAPDLE